MEKRDFDFLLGKWDVEGEYLRDEYGWKYITCYKPGHVILDFVDDAKLSCSRGGQPYYTTKYFYGEKSRELIIALAYLKTLGVESNRFIDRYRVHIVSEDEVWLYLLENVTCEPQDYCLAARLRRL